MSESDHIVAGDNVGVLPNTILDSLNHGVYVTDTERRILYWNHAATAITGWSQEDIVGKRCCDGVLCHVDKDGHALCGHEYCPLHRAIVTDQSSEVPIIVFAQSKTGPRIPVQVSVAPLRDAVGQVIGGVETFRSLADEFHDLERARKIQSLALGGELPPDVRARFNTRYVPRDIVGGDCYRILRLDTDHYGFFLADVAGHGTAGALYTMFLLSLLENTRELLITPGRFAQAMNRRLAELVGGETFATALCGVLDLAAGQMILTSAGGPPPLLIRNGEFLPQDVSGLPWGILSDTTYDEVRVAARPGDHWLFFTDGATEIQTGRGDQLDSNGLVEVLQQLQYPALPLDFIILEHSLLTRSNRIRFDDDVTFLEIGLGT